MLRNHAPRATPALALGFTLMSAAFVASNAGAADCGGPVPCACGDRMVESTTLEADLNGCQQAGLTVASGVLDCAGHQISGPGDRTLWDGVELDVAADAEVRNCRIRNFRRGIYLDGGTGNRVGENVLFDNQIGIQVGAGASANRIENNEVHDNRDEGIHLGSGSAANVVATNHVWANALENISLIDTRGNRVIENVVGESREAAIFIKHSDDNYLADNSILDRSVLVRGDSSGNVFADNDVLAGGFTFQAIDDELGVTFPHHNQVNGGSVRKASTCFRFFGAQENSVQEVNVDRCRVMETKVAEDIDSIGNLVEVLAEPPFEPDDHDPACVGCDKAASDVAAIRFNVKRPDLFKLQWSFETTVPIDPLHEEVEVVLSTPDGTVVRALVPAGELTPRRTTLRYRRKASSPVEGLKRLWLTPLGTNRWLIRAAIEGDLADADRFDLIVRWQIGTEAFVLNQGWTATSRGWRTERPRPIP